MLVCWFINFDFSISISACVCMCVCVCGGGVCVCVYVCVFNTAEIRSHFVCLSIGGSLVKACYSRSLELFEILLIFPPHPSRGRMVTGDVIYAAYYASSLKREFRLKALVDFHMTKPWSPSTGHNLSTCVIKGNNVQSSNSLSIGL